MTATNKGRGALQSETRGRGASPERLISKHVLQPWFWKLLGVFGVRKYVVRLHSTLFVNKSVQLSGHMQCGKRARHWSLGFRCIVSLISFLHRQPYPSISIPFPLLTSIHLSITQATIPHHDYLYEFRWDIWLENAVSTARIGSSKVLHSGRAVEYLVRPPL